MCFSFDNDIPPMFESIPCEISLNNSLESKIVGKNIKHSNCLTPRPYCIMKGVRAISACIHRNAAIDHNNTLWVWGANSMAQIDGVYSNDFPQNVQRIPQKFMEDVLAVSCGGWHTLCITEDKKLWSWGENEFGQLGLGDTERRDNPAFVMDKVEAICTNEYQSFAIRDDHTLWGWGWNESKTLLENAEYCCTPKLLMDHVDRVSCSSRVVAALRQDGALWIWGNNTYNVIFTKPRYHFYQPLLLMTGVMDISFPSSENSEFGLVTAKNGDLYCLGDLTFHSQKTARLLKEQGNTPLKLMNNVSSAYAGNNFIFVKDNGGRLFALGRNELGQCGTGKSTGVIKKPALIMTNIWQAAAGHAHGMALQTNGKLWIWGGDYGLR